jgi:hypothetical protein
MAKSSADLPNFTCKCGQLTFTYVGNSEVIGFNGWSIHNNFPDIPSARWIKEIKDWGPGINFDGDYWRPTHILCEGEVESSDE